MSTEDTFRRAFGRIRAWFKKWSVVPECPFCHHSILYHEEDNGGISGYNWEPAGCKWLAPEGPPTKKGVRLIRNHADECACQVSPSEIRQFYKRGVIADSRRLQFTVISFGDPSEEKNGQA